MSSRSPSRLILWVLVGTYAAIFSAVSIVKYQHYLYTDFDLAILTIHAGFAVSGDGERVVDTDSTLYADSNVVVPSGDPCVVAGVLPHGTVSVSVRELAAICCLTRSRSPAIAANTSSGDLSRTRGGRAPCQTRSVRSPSSKTVRNSSK